MPAPVVSVAQIDGTDSAASSHTIALASGTGDKIVIISFALLPGTITVTSAGWDVIDVDNDGARLGVIILAKKNTSDNNVSFTTANAVSKAWTSYIISGGDFDDIDSNIFPNSSGNTSPDPPALSGLPAADRLYLTAGIWNRGRNFVSYPASYNLNQANVTPSGNTSARLARANRALTASTGDNPAAYAINLNSETIGVTVTIPEYIPPPVENIAVARRRMLL